MVFVRNLCSQNIAPTPKERLFYVYRRNKKFPGNLTIWPENANRLASTKLRNSKIFDKFLLDSSNRRNVFVSDKNCADRSFTSSIRIQLRIQQDCHLRLPRQGTTWKRLHARSQVNRRKLIQMSAIETHYVFIDGNARKNKLSLQRLIPLRADRNLATCYVQQFLNCHYGDFLRSLTIKVPLKVRRRGGPSHCSRTRLELVYMMYTECRVTWVFWSIFEWITSSSTFCYNRIAIFLWQ